MFHELAIPISIFADAGVAGNPLSKERIERFMFFSGSLACPLNK
jgi:hypothetical protein